MEEIGQGRGGVTQLYEMKHEMLNVFLKLMDQYLADLRSDLVLPFSSSLRFMSDHMRFMHHVHTPECVLSSSLQASVRRQIRDSENDFLFPHLPKPI